MHLLSTKCVYVVASGVDDWNALREMFHQCLVGLGDAGPAKVALEAKEKLIDDR